MLEAISGCRRHAELDRSRRSGGWRPTATERRSRRRRQHRFRDGCCRGAKLLSRRHDAGKPRAFVVHRNRRRPPLLANSPPTGVVSPDPQNDIPRRGVLMSETNGKPRGRPPYRWHDKNMDAQPGDEQPPWTRKRLLRMDSRFQARLNRAFERGKENRRSAANQVCVIISAPRTLMPLCPEVWRALYRSPPLP
jgi:hypothetical protein